MIQVKRNTSEYKTVKNILLDQEDSKSRKRSVWLYTLKPYQSLSFKTLINTLKANVEILYSIAYDSLLDYFHDPSKKLFRDERSGVYFFKSNVTSKWIEVPFELRGKLKKEVHPLSVVK